VHFHLPPEFSLRFSTPLFAYHNFFRSHLP